MVYFVEPQQIVMKGVKDAFADIMTAAAKNVLSGTACAAQEIVGAFTNNLVNIVDSITGPLLGPIQSILLVEFLSSM